MQLQNFAFLGNPIEETASQDIERTVLDRSGNEVATLKAEAFNSEAKLDYSATLRSLLEPGVQVAIVSGATHSVRDYTLQVRATINGTEYVFVRGVHQTTEAIAETFKFLTGMPYLRHYEGYPLTVSHIIDHDTHTYWMVTINGDYMELDQSAQVAMSFMYHAHITTDLSENPNTDTMVTAIYTHEEPYSYLDAQGSETRPYRWQNGDYIYETENRNPTVGEEMYSVNESVSSSWTIEQVDTEEVARTMAGTLALVNSGSIVDSIKIVEKDVPVHPFYIRWINNKGGYDYFMFACKQTEAASIEKNDTYEKYGRNGQVSSYNKAGKKTVEVSTGMIDRDTLESVSDLIFSPVIELYDEETSTFVEVQVQNGSRELLSGQPTGEMTFVFELPTPQLNK